ncbi:MAG: hypothetical protein HYU66_29685 [Armatimonadetes bacterium]|nr:hypothetical protein [Armatimonadota bacterium]
MRPEDAPRRLLLDRVTRVCHYDGTRPPECSNFHSCLRGCLEFLGDEVLFDRAPKTDDRWHSVYIHLIGTSGASFRLLWPHEGWEGVNPNPIYMAEDPLDMLRRSFEAAGLGFSVCLRRSFAEETGLTGEIVDDEAEYRRRIVLSLNEGKPVIAFGLVGPPEASLIVGYDEGGDVLIGWSGFQDDDAFKAGLQYEPTKQFRKRRWFDDTLGLVLLGEPADLPPADDMARRALRHAVEVMETPSARGRYSGLAAYTAWAEALLRDEDFPTTANADLLMQRYVAHFLTALTVAEGRHYSNVWCRALATRNPAWSDPLVAAAQCFSDQHDLMWAIWEFTGGNDVSPATAKKLSDPGVRRRIAPLTRIARKLEAQAAGHLRKALGG